MKIASYVVAVLGIVAIALGVYWDLVKHDHPARGLVALIAGAVVLIAGIVGAFVLGRPKAEAVA